MTTFRDEYPALAVVADALAENREVNGGELESVLTIFTHEGLAALVGARLVEAGYNIRTAAASAFLDDLAGRPCFWREPLGCKGEGWAESRWCVPCQAREAIGGTR